MGSFPAKGIYMVYKNKKHLIQSLIQKEDTVLDVGFWGQGVLYDSKDWPHNIIKEVGAQVYGVDLTYDDSKVSPKDHYQKTSAENARFPVRFTKVFAGDVIEHLSNPGQFLDACYRLLDDTGSLIITTPNTFNLFNIAEKITKTEPTVNSDHTCYFNSKTLICLLKKNNFEVISVDYLYTLDTDFKPSWKKRFLDGLHFLVSFVTDKFTETLVVVARKKI